MKGAKKENRLSPEEHEELLVALNARSAAPSLVIAASAMSSCITMARSLTTVPGHFAAG